MKYLDRLINKVKDVVQEGKLRSQAKQSQLAIQSSRIDTDAKIEEKELEIQALKEVYPLDIKGIATKQAEINGLKEGQAFLDELEKELFPKE